MFFLIYLLILDCFKNCVLLFFSSFCLVIYWFFFSISTFKIKYIGSRGFIFFFNWLSMNLFQSYDLDREFNKLIQVDLGHFFVAFSNWFFFNMGLIGNWVSYFFFIWFLQDYPDLMTSVTSLTSWLRLTMFIFLFLF